MEGSDEADKPSPELPKTFYELCEDDAQNWPAGWQVEFAKSGYFYVAGFVEYLNWPLKDLNVTAVQRRLNAVLERAKANIPDRWLDISTREDMAYTTRRQRRAEKLAEYDLAKFGRRRIERLRFMEPVTYHTAMLAVACLNEWMGEDPEETRSISEVVEIRWAGYLLHPWFESFLDTENERLMHQLCGRTHHLGHPEVFSDIAAGFPITLPLAKRIQEFVHGNTQGVGRGETSLPISKITGRSDPSRKRGASMGKRPAKGERIYFRWPPSNAEE